MCINLVSGTNFFQVNSTSNTIATGSVYKMATIAKVFQWNLKYIKQVCAIFLEDLVHHTLGLWPSIFGALN